MIERQNIDHIATLARIAVTDGEAQELTEKLSGILAMVDQLQALDTDGIEPMAHPGDAYQRLRADIVTEDNHRDHFQQCAPKVENGLYLVPQVIDQEKK